ncbi:MAG: hypothetical protein QXJ23_09675 [Thermofilum sp.]|uniref:hypothetical protein n=1 Tax=Thermofilum sp. TaxID=1961369 RepID=UPI00316EFAD6
MSRTNEVLEKEKKEKLEKLDRRLDLVSDWSVKLTIVFLALCLSLLAINTMFIKRGDYDGAGFIENIMMLVGKTWLLIMIGIISYSSYLRCMIIWIDQTRRWSEIKNLILTLLLLGMSIEAFFALI